MIVLTTPPAALDAETIAALCPGAEIIFCEGLAVPGAAILLAAGDASDEIALKRPLSETDIFVARAPSLRKLAAARGVPAFAPEEIGRIIDRLFT